MRARLLVELDCMRDKSQLALAWQKESRICHRPSVLKVPYNRQNERFLTKYENALWESSVAKHMR